MRGIKEIKKPDVVFDGKIKETHKLNHKSLSFIIIDKEKLSNYIAQSFKNGKIKSLEAQPFYSTTDLILTKF